MNLENPTAVAKAILKTFDWSEFCDLSQDSKFSNDVIAYSQSFKDFVFNMTNSLLYGVSTAVERYGFTITKQKRSITFTYMDAHYAQTIVITESSSKKINSDDANLSKPSDVGINKQSASKTKAATTKETYIYRARLKGQTKYISTSKSKSTWQREYAIIDVVKSDAKHRGKQLSDYEICLFPVTAPITKSADEFANAYADIQKEKVLSAKKRKALERKKQLESMKVKLMEQAAKLQDEINKIDNE